MSDAHAGKAIGSKIALNWSSVKGSPVSSASGMAIARIPAKGLVVRSPADTDYTKNTDKR